MTILVRTEPKSIRNRRGFKTENWWLAREDFKTICQQAAQQGNNEWEEVRSALKKGVKKWDAAKESPQVLLGKVESEMFELNSLPQTQDTIAKEWELQKKHNAYLTMLEIFWHRDRESTGHNLGIETPLSFIWRR